MAEIWSFPNNSAEYQGAEEVMRWLHGRTKGVYAGTGNAAVSAVNGTMQVIVAPGIGWITDANDDGICWWFDEAITLSVDAAESTGTLNRIDRVIIEWKTTDYADLPEVKVLKGANRSSATPPDLTNNSSVRQISLAKISIPAGTTQLTALNIIDERMDNTVCGLVTETATADTSMIAAQYEAALETLYAAISQAWSGVISDGAVDTDKLADNAVTPAKVDSTLLAAVCDMIYPVGSLYMSTDSTSPASRFGGTWEQIKDKFLLSAGDTYTAGVTGGSATKNIQHKHTTGSHKLIESEFPQRTGYFDIRKWYTGSIIVGTSGKFSTLGYQGINANPSVADSGNAGKAERIRYQFGSNGTHSHGDTGNAGSTTQDIMPPYLTVYVWKRTA